MFADATSLLLREYLSGMAEKVLGDGAEWFGENNLKLIVETLQSLQWRFGEVFGHLL